MKHIRLFEKDSDYEYYLSSGDNIARPNLSLVKENGRVGYKKKIKRIAKFSVNEEGLDSEYNNTVRGNKILLRDCTNVKSIRVNGEDSGWRPPTYSDTQLTYEEVMSALTFDGDAYSATTDNSGNTIYTPNTPIGVDDSKITMDENSMWDIGLFEDNFDINKWGLGFFVYAELDGQFGYFPLVLEPLNDILSDVCELVNSKYIKIKSELVSMIKQELATSQILVLFYNQYNPEKTSYTLIQRLTDGVNYFAVNNNGYYELEIEFNSNQIPLTIFADNTQYDKPSLVGLSEDFLDSMENLPILDCPNLRGKIVIPDSVKGSLFSSFASSSYIDTLVVGTGITSIANYSLPKSIKKIEFKSRQSPSCGNNVFAYSDISYMQQYSYPYGADYSNWDIYKSHLYNGKQFDRMDKELDEYDIICIYYINSSGTYTLSSSSNVAQIKVNNIVLEKGIKKYTFNNTGLYTVRYKLMDGITVCDSQTFGAATSNLIYCKFSNNITDISSSLMQARSLVDVVLSNSLTKIPSSAFTFCNRLTEINIPESVTSIGDYAFGDIYRGCASLKKINIPESVTSIGNYAFASCVDLEEINIPTNVTVIPNYCFYRCESLRYINLHDNIISLESYCFSNCLSLTEINIPESVTSIGSGIFRYCHTLTDVILPKSITSITSELFMGCRNLKDINLHENIASIENKAFSKCVSLKDVIIPESVTSIGNGVFSQCTNLTSCQLPSNTTTISTEMFSQCKSLKEVPSLSNITTIGSSAFEYCNGLTSVVIPDNVTTMGEFVFSYCQSLKKVTVSNNMEKLPRYAFNGCFNLTEVTIGNGIKTIGEAAFSYCNQLTSITIPNTVKEIGGYAFNTCGLTEVIGGENVEILNSGVFNNTPLLKSVSGETMQYVNTWLVKTTASDSVVVDNMTTCIASDAFSNNNITAITLPNGIKAIANNTFSHISKLLKINIPNTVTTIGDYAFEYCTSLTSIDVPDSVTIIGAQAFNNCSSLTNITLGNGITSIKYRTFYGCSGLTSVVIPDSVISIGDSAFASCSGLTNITIGVNLTDIGSTIFSNCSNLASITCKVTTTPTINSDTFRNIHKNGILYYPQGSDYSSWMKTSSYYLGYYNWTSQETDFTESATE